MARFFDLATLNAPPPWARTRGHRGPQTLAPKPMMSGVAQGSKGAVGEVKQATGSSWMQMLGVSNPTEEQVSKADAGIQKGAGIRPVSPIMSPAEGVGPGGPDMPSAEGRAASTFTDMPAGKRVRGGPVAPPAATSGKRRY